jgi:syntaxin-binding protein 1
LSKRRQPMRTLEAVYFLHPSRESVGLFMEDMAGKLPIYKKAHVFFSTQLPSELLQLIKSSPFVLSLIASLAEVPFFSCQVVK